MALSNEGYEKRKSSKMSPDSLGPIGEGRAEHKQIALALANFLKVSQQHLIVDHVNTTDRSSSIIMEEPPLYVARRKQAPKATKAVSAPRGSLKPGWKSSRILKDVGCYWPSHPSHSQ